MAPPKPKEIPLNGKLVTAIDPANIKPSDFRELRNMRYGDQSPHGVGGCTKYNTTPLGSTGIRNGIHFRKGNPVESHVVTATSDGKLWRNGTAIGSQGNFDSALWSTAGNTTPRFAIAPQGALVACDGVNTLVYGGTEFRCAGFIDYPETGKVYDYSEEVANSLASSDQLATIHAANSASDANTMLLLHLDNNVTDDSPTTAHTVTNTNVTFSTSVKKFGTHGAVFNGANAQLSVPDDADFDFSGGIFTIDYWIKFTATTGTQVIFHQGTDANNYMRIYYVNGMPRLQVVAASSAVIDINPGRDFYPSSWTHYAWVENGDSWYLFINGALCSVTTDTDRAGNYTGTAYIGSSSAANYLNASVDEFRISNSARWTSSFSPPSAAYGGGYASTSYIGSILPLSGFKAYVATANAVASTMAVSEWDGNAWSALTVTDNTASGGISIAQTGTVTWPSSASTSKPKVIEKTLLYWYKVVITASATFSATLSQVTVVVPIQQLKELWDGEPRPLTAFLGVKSGLFYDYTPNVLEDSIDSANSYTWAGIGQYTASDYLLVGSMEQLMGVILNLADTAVNTNAMIASVLYWDGAAWVALTLDDTTKDGTKSFGKSGMITWSPPVRNAEHKQTTFSSHTVAGGVFVPNASGGLTGTDSWWRKLSQEAGINNGKIPAESRRSSFPAYYYKITFSGTLSGSDANGVKVYYAAGIPAPQSINGYAFAVEHQESVWLFDNYDGKRNSFMASAPNTVNVFNGKDSYRDELGVSGDPPLAAASMVTRYGVAISDTLVVPKANDTYTITGTNPSEYVQRRLKGNIGIVAPLTMTVIPIGDEAIQGISRNIVMWIATQGAVACDGNSVNIVSDDIADLFDPRHTNYIGAAALAASTAGYDPVYDAFVWCIGGSTTWRYDLKRKKWHEVPMSSNTRLYGVFNALDSNGVACLYGYGNSGYVWKLDSGNTFDGDAIDQSIWMADIAEERNYISVETFTRQFKLAQKAKLNTANSVTITHYGDTKTAGNVVETYSPQASGRRLNDRVISKRMGPHVFHSWRMTLSTTDEPMGFEPLMVSVLYEPVRQDTRGN